MKRIFRSFYLSLLFVSVSSPVFAADHQTVYGLQHAQHFMSQANTPYYIQTESFLDAAKAERYRTLLGANTAYAVLVVMRGKFHVVVIGPFSTDAEVRRTANNLVAVLPKEKKPVRKSHPKIIVQAKISPVMRVPSVLTPQQPKRTEWVVSVGGGQQNPTGFYSHQTVNNGSGFSAPNNVDVYTTKSSSQPLVALSVGRRWVRESTWLPAYSVGLTYQRSFSTNVGGTITQYSNPAYLNYNYDWDISSDVVLAMLKLNLVNFHAFSPFVTAGVGGAFNRSSHYGETALPGVSSPRVSAGFASKTTTQLAYVVGAGLDYQLSPQWIISAEYQYQNLGNIALGNGSGAWAGQSLHLGTYHSNAVLVNLSYLLEK